MFESLLDAYPTNNLVLGNLKKKIPTLEEISNINAVLLLNNTAEIRVSLLNYINYKTISIKFTDKSTILDLLKLEVSKFKREYFQNHQQTFFENMKLKDYLTKFNNGLNRYEKAIELEKYIK
jgi:hypothetical protein